ncbi:alpha/beta fold hydrolase [Eisenibacter elegans]|uniref:alpha/beta fold hydrolase n=1 Tax=Eisenibacter elegans TaxID=997 RepID=UPI00047890D0|nr:alpha/beta fold hydrolase [Eisenibacter elegans]
MELFYRVLGQGDPVVILHGLFGASDNWMSIAKTLSENYTVYLLDQRNHGQSPWSDEWDYSAMSRDLYAFLETQQIHNPYLIGHSMGGKTVMWFAASHPEVALRKLVVVDIAPRSYPIHHDEIIEALNSLDLNAHTSRSALDQALAQRLPQPMLRQFLLKNLERDGQQFRWKINLPIISQKLENVGQGMDNQGFAPVQVPTLFIAGANSDYIQEGDYALMAQLFPQMQVSVIAQAGHWVHAEQPDTFTEVLSGFLKA